MMMRLRRNEQMHLQDEHMAESQNFQLPDEEI